MADWDFDNWVAVCKDCERYQGEIRLLKEKQEKVQQLLVAKDQIIDDVQNFRQLIINTDGVYKSLSKVAAAKQRLKERNALYQERQRLMLSVVSRLTVLIYSSLHFMRLWEDEHEITKRAIDVTVDQRQQLEQQNAKLLGIEQMQKQYVALVAEQAEKLKVVENMEKEVANLKKIVKKQDRQHTKTLERAVSAFLEILSQYHMERKLSRKQAVWLENCEKSMAGKKISDAMRYTPLFKSLEEVKEDDVDGEDDCDETLSAKVDTSSRDVAVGDSDCALLHDACVGTEDLITEVSGLAGDRTARSETVVPGVDDGCSDKSPDSGIQTLQSPLSQASQETECWTGSVDSCRNLQLPTIVSAPFSLEEGYMSESPATPYNDWSMVDHDYYRRDDNVAKPQDIHGMSLITDPHRTKESGDVDSIRTSTPYMTKRLHVGESTEHMAKSVDKQLEHVFGVIGTVSPKTYPGKRQLRVAKEKVIIVDKEQTNTSEKVVTHSDMQQVDIPEREQNPVDKENSRNQDSCLDNQKAIPLKKRQILVEVEQQKALSLEALLLEASGDEAATNAKSGPTVFEKCERGRMNEPAGNITEEMFQGWGSDFTSPRKNPVCDGVQQTSSGKNVPVPLKSIFDVSSESDEDPVKKQAVLALEDGGGVDKRQVSAEQELFGDFIDTDEEDGWEAVENPLESMSEVKKVLKASTNLPELDFEKVSEAMETPLESTTEVGKALTIPDVPLEPISEIGKVVEMLEDSPVLMLEVGKAIGIVEEERTPEMCVMRRADENVEVHVSEEVMVHGDGASVVEERGSSIVRQDSHNEVIEDEVNGVGSLLTMTLEGEDTGGQPEGEDKGSEQVNNCVGNICKNDEVPNVENPPMKISKGSDEGTVVKEIIAAERECVNGSCGDRQLLANVVCGKSSFVGKQAAGNDKSNHSVQTIGDSIILCVDDQLQNQREDAKSPDIARMLAEFTQYCLLSPVSPEVLNEEGGGEQSQSGVSGIQVAGPADRIAEPSAGEQHTGKDSSMENVECELEIKYVSVKATNKERRKTRKLPKQDVSQVMCEKQNGADKQLSTEICRVEKKCVKNYEPSHQIINLQESSLTRITTDLKDCVETYFTKIMDETVHKREFEDFVAKEFTPFKNAITETLEEIKAKITSFQETSASCGGMSGRGTPGSAKRSSGVTLSQRKRVRKTRDTIDTTPPQPHRSTRSHASRRSSTRSLVSSGSRDAGVNNVESSDSDCNSESSFIKLPAKCGRRLVLSSSDSSDEELLKRRCRNSVCKVSLKNILLKGDNSNELAASGKQLVVGKKDCSNIKCTGEENITVKSNENNCFNAEPVSVQDDSNVEVVSFMDTSNAEHIHIPNNSNVETEVGRGRALRKRNISVCESEDSGGCKGKRGNVKRRTAFESRRKSSLLSSEKEVESDEETPPPCSRKKNNLRKSKSIKKLGIFETLKPNVETKSQMEIAVRSEQFELKERSSESAPTGKINNTAILENGCVRRMEYKIPNAKPLRIARKGNNDLEENLPYNLDLNFKREYLSEKFKAISNARTIQKTKKPSLLKKIISKCERISKIGKVEEKDAKPTRRRKKARVCSLSKESDVGSNDESEKQTADSGKEKLPMLSQEYLVCHENADSCETLMLSDYYKPGLSSQEVGFPLSKDTGDTIVSEEQNQADLRSARIEPPGHDVDVDGCKTPTFTEYYSSKVLPRRKYSVCDDNIDGSRTPTYSEYYSNDLLLPSRLNYSGPNSSLPCGSRQDGCLIAEEPFNAIANESLAGACKPPTAANDRRTSPVSLTRPTACIVGLQGTSAGSRPVAVQEGVTLTNHSTGHSVSPLCPSLLIFPERIKVEKDREGDWDGVMDSDPSEDDGRNLVLTPPAKTYGRNRSGTSCPVEKEVRLQHLNQSESLGTQSRAAHVVNLDDSNVEDLISVEAVIGDSDSSLSVNSDVKEVANNVIPSCVGFNSREVPMTSNVNLQGVVSSEPLYSPDSVIMRPKHCAAMVVTKPLHPSSVIAKPPQSELEPHTTLHLASNESIKNLSRTPGALQNRSCAVPSTMRSTASSAPGPSTSRMFPQASSVQVPRAPPGPFGSRGPDVQPGGKDPETAATKQSFQECWRPYFVRAQHKVHADRKFNTNPNFQHMETYADGILTEFLKKELSQKSVDATVYSLTNYSRGMTAEILAISIIRATMNNISRDYVEVRKGMPRITDAEHHLLALVFKLSNVAEFRCTKDAILSSVVYGMFRLCRTPQADVLYALTRLFVLLCLRYRLYTHILMLCCDALFTLNYGAFPVVYAALFLYDKLLLRANLGKEQPLCLVISHVLLSHQNINDTPLFKVESLKKLVCKRYGYQRGEFMFPDVLKKLSGWLREGRVTYMERAYLILAKKQPWHIVNREIIKKQLMMMLSEWQDQKLSETSVLVVIRLLGYVPRSFPCCPKTFVVVAEVLDTLSGLLGRPGNTAQIEEAVVTAVMALANHAFSRVLGIVRSWKPLRPLPDTFFDPLYSMRKFRDWPALLETAKVKTTQ
ncbi:uncharacterized protein LOC134528365 isoform X2 [Bacillus rossius redtenbacheri]|uniref:uncharacterized protein LOC134528365 isoform X2 n=1 Tax=Bacillus rossius redtenbacheri TaxID=93214 RepID=UPI002FDE9CEB